MSITDSTLQIHEAPYRIITPDSIAVDTWCVIWIQGFGSSIADHTERVSRLAELTRLPYAMVDYAGQGRSTIPLADSTRQMQIDEVCALYDQLTALGYSKCIVLGNSLGSYLTAMLSELRPSECIVLRAPAIYPDDELDVPQRDKEGDNKLASRKLWRQNVTKDTDTKALHAVEKFSGHTYVIEHDRDEIIPANIPKAYFTHMTAGNYIHIPDCEHTPKTMQDPEKYHAIIENWLATIVRNELAARGE